MHYSVSWSGGKDSTASIILAHEHNEPIDSIVFVEVMYDLKRNISGENPEHINFIKNVAKPMFESWGYKVHILRSDKDYISSFNRIMEKPRKHIENKGLCLGFPVFGMCGIKRDCKVSPITKFYKSIEGDCIQYVGIAIDEPKRLESLKKDSSRISLLEKYGYTEEMARDLCEKYGLLSPAYKYSKRQGCWFCPNAKLAEHKAIRESMPDVWHEFVSLENVSNLANYKYNVYGRTLHEIDDLLKFEDAQMTIFDYLNQ